MAATNSASSTLAEVPPVACVRCAVVAAHPFGHHADRCPNCGRSRE